MAKYTSRLAQDVGQYAETIRRGSLLAIDPSSGSSGSLPAYALFQAGKLVDVGTIEIPRSGQLHNRLFLLREALQREFKKPDILAVEWISPVMPSKGGQFLHKHAASLIKAVGAILSCWDCPTLEPSPSTWHAIAPAGYQKSDERDAVMIGMAVFTTLARVTGTPEPELPDFVKPGYAPAGGSK